MAKRNAVKSSKFHPTQIAYMTARAAYEVAYEAYIGECKALGLYEREDDESYEIQDQLSEKHDVMRLLRALRAAERTMVDWSVDHACDFAPAQAAEIRDLRSKVERYPDLWNRMIDIAARLAA